MSIATAIWTIYLWMMMCKRDLTAPTKQHFSQLNAKRTVTHRSCMSPTRLEEGYIQGEVYGRQTWSGRYTKFNSSVNIQQNSNLLMCLAFRVRTTCAAESLDNNLGENAHRDRPTEKNAIEKLPDSPEILFDEKDLFISLSFKRYAIGKILKPVLCRAVPNTSNATTLHWVLHDSPLFQI